MKNTKTTTKAAGHGFAQAADVVDEIKSRMRPAQRGALETLCGALDATGGDGEAELDTMMKALSIGLFALGVDPSGDGGLGEIADALYGKDSDDAATVYNAIVDAGGTACDTWANAERARRGGARRSGTFVAEVRE